MGFTSDWRNGLFGVLGAQYSKEISPTWSISAGYESFLAPGINLSIPFLNTTIGNENTHYTFMGGVGLTTLKHFNFLPFNFSMYHRINDKIAFVTENWVIVAPDVIPNYDYDAPLYEGPCFEYEVCHEATYSYDWEYNTTLIFQAIGIRFISKNLTTDIGIVNTIVDDEYIPLPWLDISWYFGQTN